VLAFLVIFKNSDGLSVVRSFTLKDKRLSVELRKSQTKTHTAATEKGGD